MNDWFNKSLVDCTLQDIWSLIGLAFICIQLSFIIVDLIDRFIKKKRGNKK